ncbi:MAG: flagellar hook assembly protein FlgD [Spirochaetaceae bacterium]|nr:flagellar hook assembly protein FlgD [Spirochaetaceae bacterium]
MSDIASPVQMNNADRAQLDEQVNLFNKALNNGQVKSQEMGKDDFMKILIAQLSHQDPTKPMEDKEFIAQMAQFSSLEQITNMSQNFQKLNGRMNQSQAFNMLGKNVEFNEGDQSVSGTVEAATGGEFPQLLVNGKYIDMSEVIQVSNN